MSYGISKLSIIPGRKEPSDKAENVTQVLFGEHYIVEEEAEKWLRIRTSHDGYECWIDRKQHTPLRDEEFNRLETSENPRTLDLLGIAKDQSINNYFNLPLGSQLPFFEDGDFNIGTSNFRFKGTLAVPAHENLLPYAHLFLNAPYLWGGRTPFGIDCSGFAQMCYLLIGIKIPRDAYLQAEIGTTIESLDDAEAGDLAFFSNEQGRVTHVGIMVTNDEIIHASGSVKIETIDHRGIYNVDMKGYSHNLTSIKRILKTD